MAKIVIAGGTGFIGQYLVQHYRAKGDEVVVLSRQPKASEPGLTFSQWDSKHLGDWVHHLEGCALLINLTGKSVNCRYNEANKKAILESRVDATRVLGSAIGLLAQPPALWVNAGSATIYRHAEDQPQDEWTGEAGKGFSVEVCQQWERTFFAQKTPKTRLVALRIAIVLGENGGVLPYFHNLARFGLGGKQGTGQQYFSWIHEQDLAGIIDFLEDRTDLTGVFNAAAPNPIPNYAFMREIRRARGVTFGLDTPGWLLHLGAVFLRTEPELILKSRWVLPTRLLESGYSFRLNTLREALVAGAATQLV